MPPLPLTGALTGPFEIHGEALQADLLLVANGGPHDDSGSHCAPGGAPLDAPSTWWTIQPLRAGTYTNFYADAYLRTGRAFTSVRLPYFNAANAALGPLQVVAGTTSALTRDIHGERRYPFVVTPAFLEGSIRLVNPSIPASPDAPHTLRHLYFEADHDDNHDGVPNTVNLQQTRLFAFVSGRDHTELGFSTTAFAGNFDSHTGELSSRYEQVLPGTYDLPYTWTQRSLKLRFWSQGESLATHPGRHDPRTFRDGSLELFPRKDSSKKLGPGERHRIDHEYCFNELKLLYPMEWGRIYNPALDLGGGYTGKDWRGRDVDYGVSGSFHGDPYVSGYPVADHPRSTGVLFMTLPQGTFTLSPRVTQVDDSGGKTEVRPAPVKVTTGCGQWLTVVPPLAVGLQVRRRCAPDGGVSVSGVVRSHPVGVDRVWYQVNDGPEVTLCTKCGEDIPFSFTVHPRSREDTVRVFAQAVGSEEPAMTSQQVELPGAEDPGPCAQAP